MATVQTPAAAPPAAPRPGVSTMPTRGREFAADRRWDILLLIGAFFVITGAVHLTMMLFVGDWDMWTDWKDRVWWPIVTPTAAIVICSALQYIVWGSLRLPLGATLTMVCLLFGTWMVRWTNFGGWDYFPINYVWPATLVPGALLLDLVMMRTNSYLITSMLGGFLFGLVFYWGCWPALAPFLQPVLYHGHVLSLSDLQGFQYLRTGDHEYMRLIETGNLRAFLQESLYVAMFFSGFTSMFAYWIGIGIGRWLAVYPATKFLKQA